MEYLRVRKIGIDVLPDSEPFISVNIEKVIFDESTNQPIQVIGDFDRIYRKLSDINPLPVNNIADDGLVDPFELYTLIATTTYIWLIQSYGGHMEGDRLVIS